MTTTRRAPAPWTTALMDAVQLLGLAVSVPVAILIVGAPLALLGALVVWLARLVLGTS